MKFQGTNVLLLSEETMKGLVKDALSRWLPTPLTVTVADVDPMNDPDSGEMFFRVVLEGSPAPTPDPEYKESKVTGR